MTIRLCGHNGMRGRSRLRLRCAWHALTPRLIAQAARAIEISGKDANLKEEDKVRPDPPSDWKVDLIEKDKDDPQKLAAHYGTTDEVACDCDSC